MFTGLSGGVGGELPSFFKDEEELRQLWSVSGTRRKLLEKLSDKGYTAVKLEDLKKVVNGEDRDLFDVLAYITWKMPKPN